MERQRGSEKGRMMEERVDRLLTIAELSGKLNVPKHTIRFWERAFKGMVLPLRTTGGQRRYSSDDLLVIDRIRRLRAEGMGLPEIRRSLGNGDGESSSPGTRIDLLAERVAQAVKAEVYSFFGVEGSKE
jgi:DNA-binding transcriptional MerR regulator